MSQKNSTSKSLSSSSSSSSSSSLPSNSNNSLQSLPFQTPYLRSYVDPGIDFTLPDGSKELKLTKDSEAEACDVNVILARAAKSAGLVEGNSAEPRFGDFASGQDFQAAMNLVIDAQNQFASLDAKLRRRFGNDPALFLEFMSDPENTQEAIKLGLASAPPSPASPAPGEAPAASKAKSAAASVAAKPDDNA